MAPPRRPCGGRTRPPARPPGQVVLVVGTGSARGAVGRAVSSRPEPDGAPVVRVSTFLSVFAAGVVSGVPCTHNRVSLKTPYFYHTENKDTTLEFLHHGVPPPALLGPVPRSVDPVHCAGLAPVAPVDVVSLPVPSMGHWRSPVVHERPVKGPPACPGRVVPTSLGSGGSWSYDGALLGCCGPWSLTSYLPRDLRGPRTPLLLCT